MANLRINLVVWFVLVAFSTAYGAERKDLLSLLEQKRYSTIEATIVSAAKAAENNPSQERVLNVYLDQFITPRSSLEDMLKDWVAASETSYIPYLAKGIYFTSMGWNRRGFKYLSKTDRNQIDGMSLYFGKAYQDLARSLMIEPRQVHAQSYLIEILMNLNQGEEVERLLKNALAYRPESLTARWYYLTTLLPRWGGSIDKMAAFVQSTRPYYKRNAALKVLDGRASRAGKHAAAPPPGCCVARTWLRD